MSLKDLTWEHHKNAERQDFVKIMMSGYINPKFYAIFLWNLHAKYDLLEALADVNGCLNDLPDIKRKSKIADDFSHLWGENPNGEMPETLPSTKAYIEHMRHIMHDPEKIMAHIYVFHMGDLSGGQMISKKVPGLGKMFQFSTDVDNLKTVIRSKINDDMAEEARWAFESATHLFKEMMDLDCEHYLEQTDNMSE